MDRLLKLLLVFIYDFRLRRTLRKKAAKIIAFQRQKGFTGSLSKEIKEKYRDLWRGMAAGSDEIWLEIYLNASEIADHRYVPETVYYNLIEPCLNNKTFSKAYTDKNFYKKLSRDLKIPETLIRNIEGVFYDNNDKSVDKQGVLKFLDSAGEFIIKPAVESGGGRDVALCRRHGTGFRTSSGIILDAEAILNRYSKNFIIQEVIIPHPFYEAFNPSSLNTVRMLTYRSVSDERIHILQSILRAGQTGSITDNQASGGFACGLTKDGNLTGKSVDKHGNIYKEVNGISLVPGTQAEGFKLIAGVAAEVASFFPYSRLLGLDLCLDSKGEVRLIEVNNLNNEINFFQMANGPLFGEFTEEIISYCSSNKRSFLIDFEI